VHCSNRSAKPETRNMMLCDLSPRKIVQKYDLDICPLLTHLEAYDSPCEFPDNVLAHARVQQRVLRVQITVGAKSSKILKSFTFANLLVQSKLSQAYLLPRRRKKANMQRNARRCLLHHAHARSSKTQFIGRLRRAEAVRHTPNRSPDENIALSASAPIARASAGSPRETRSCMHVSSLWWILCLCSLNPAPVHRVKDRFEVCRQRSLLPLENATAWRKRDCAAQRTGEEGEDLTKQAWRRRTRCSSFNLIRA